MIISTAFKQHHTAIYKVPAATINRAISMIIASPIYVYIPTTHMKDIRLITQEESHRQVDEQLPMY